ncbi:hypothetical protein [Candidatus Pristimantibacillus sp. PTI5]|uniref:hypothetical protein n=1 Tax=Candidatus Pristimantibacillus sp. PTI5 TaxID=3400422 RepID=UPI003B01124A
MARALVAGTFDSESYWRDSQSARLPALRDRGREKIILAMDELLFPLCGSGDALVTRYAMEEAHKAYLARIGFSFKHFTLKREDAENNVFEAIASDCEHKEEFAGYGQLSPFSIVPSVHKVVARYGYHSELPSYETVKRVNSKLYSTLLTEMLLGKSQGKPVYSWNELRAAGGEMLKECESLLVKDPYGVSGNGNMLIQTEQALERLVAYIRKQEEAGFSAAFILEPYMDVASDFSCQFEITPSGTFHLVSMQKILNRQFAYVGSMSMEEKDIATLERAGYFDVVMQVAGSLYRDGYFGPVCIDSMSLRDGKIVPIVEINARQSMGFINHHLDNVLEGKGKKGFLTFRSVGFRDRFDYESWIMDLEGSDLLYPNRTGNGILPLSSATLLANAYSSDQVVSTNAGYCKGKLYMTIVADNAAERDRYLELMRLLFEHKGGKWYS